MGRRVSATWQAASFLVCGLFACGSRSSSGGDDLLRAGIDAGAEARGESTFWGPSLGLGVELGVRGKRPEAWTASGARTAGSL